MMRAACPDTMGRAADPSVSMGSNLSPAVAVRDLVKTYPRPEGGTFNAVDGIGRRSFGRARPLTTAERGWHERSTRRTYRRLGLPVDDDKVSQITRPIKRRLPSPAAWPKCRYPESRPVSTC